MSRADANGDGAITTDEMEGRQALISAEAQSRIESKSKDSRAFFERADLDNSGSVTADEMRAAIFDRLDRDGDQMLSKRELRAMARADRFRKKAGHSGPRLERCHRLERSRVNLPVDSDAVEQDLVLLERLRGGDPDAFSQLMNRLLPQIERYVYRPYPL